MFRYSPLSYANIDHIVLLNNFASVYCRKNDAKSIRNVHRRQSNTSVVLHAALAIDCEPQLHQVQYPLIHWQWPTWAVDWSLVRDLCHQ